MSEIYDPRVNGFGFLRLVFSLLVIVAHAYPIGSLGLCPLMRFSEGQETFGGVAVRGFFVLSGFLITGSLLHHPSIVRFLWHRFLRIMPGFVVALVLVAFGLAPLMHWLREGNMTGFAWSGPLGPISYVRSNLFLEIKQHQIADITATLPYPHTINGSLWTLILEVKAYLITAILGFFGFLRFRSLSLLLTVGLYATYLINFIWPGTATKVLPVFLADSQFLSFLLCYFLGMTAYQYMDRIFFSSRLAFGAVVCLVVCLRSGSYVVFAPILSAYLIFYLATGPSWKGLDRRCDVSYGIYIYAFLIQQLLAQLRVHEFGPTIYIFGAMLATLPLAFFSFYLVERPALKLKNALDSISKYLPWLNWKQA